MKKTVYIFFYMFSLGLSGLQAQIDQDFLWAQPIQGKNIFVPQPTYAPLLVNYPSVTFNKTDHPSGYKSIYSDNSLINKKEKKHTNMFGSGAISVIERKRSSSATAEINTGSSSGIINSNFSFSGKSIPVQKAFQQPTTGEDDFSDLSTLLQEDEITYVDAPLLGGMWSVLLLAGLYYFALRSKIKKRSKHGRT